MKKRRQASELATQRETSARRIKISDDLIWGSHPVLEGLAQQPERFVEVVLVRDRHGRKHEEIVERARQVGVKITWVSAIKLTGANGPQVRHQGVVARVSSTPLVDFSTLVERFTAAARAGKCPRLLVCDSLQDPHNLGAAIRSALASGAVGVIVTRERSAPLGGTAAKASAGALAHIDICQVTNLVTALQELKAVGGWIFGAVKESSSISLYETDLAVPACIVIGGEGKGIRPLVRRECDVLVTIPMAGELDSLNSSVAAAVILFEARRQALASGRM